MVMPRKGLSSVRTLSGRVNQTFTPYRAYMQITCLEMEKSRRVEEQKSANARIAGISVRLQEIEAEKQALERALQRMEAEMGITGAGEGSVEKARGQRQTQRAERPHQCGLRLRY